MAGGAGAGADGGAGGGGGGGDGRGPSGGSTSSGGRSLQGECPSVSLRLGAEAVPGAALGVPARKGLSLVVRGPCCGPGRRRRRWTAAREGAVVRPGGEATSAADWPVPVHPEGRARPGAAVPGAEARGVALGAGSAALGGRGGPSGSGLRAPGAEGRDPPLPGLRETAPQTRARVYRAAGLWPSRGGWEGGQPELKSEQAAPEGRS